MGELLLTVIALGFGIIALITIFILELLNRRKKQRQYFRLLTRIASNLGVDANDEMSWTDLDKEEHKYLEKYLNIKD